MSCLSHRQFESQHFELLTLDPNEIRSVVTPLQMSIEVSPQHTHALPWRLYRDSLWDTPTRPTLSNFQIFDNQTTERPCRVISRTTV